MCDAVRLNSLTSDLVAEYCRLFGGSLRQAILYGSYAHGDSDEGSDVDVAALVDCSRETLCKTFEQLGEISSELSLAYGVTVSPTAIPLEDSLKISGLFAVLSQYSKGRSPVICLILSGKSFPLTELKLPEKPLKRLSCFTKMPGIKTVLIGPITRYFTSLRAVLALEGVDYKKTFRCYFPFQRKIYQALKDIWALEVYHEKIRIRERKTALNGAAMTG